MPIGFPASSAPAPDDPASSLLALIGQAPGAVASVLGRLQQIGPALTGQPSLTSRMAQLYQMQQADPMAMLHDPQARALGTDIAGNFDFLGPIKAYHGTPHVFAPEPDYPLGRFRDDKIGTGEGAQAFGHGLYVAENPAVARGYQDRLTGLVNDEVPTGNFVDDVGIVDNAPAGFSSALGVSDAPKNYSHDELVAIAQSRLDQAGSIKGGARADAVNRAKSVLGFLNDNPSLRFDSEHSPGSLYQTTIAHEPEQFLDWDKPLSEQSPAVRDAALRTLNEKLHKDYKDLPEGPASWTGADFYGMLNEGVSSNAPKTSAALRDAGIPGIRYLDEGSRHLPDPATASDLAVRDQGGGTWLVTANDPRRGALSAGRIEKQGGRFWARVGTGDSQPFDTLDEAKKYALDAATKDERTRNYVVFDPSSITIDARDGQPIGFGGGAGGGGSGGSGPGAAPQYAATVAKGLDTGGGMGFSGGMKAKTPEPPTFYHGSTADFSAFDPTKAGSGAMADTHGFNKGGSEVYLADTPEHASYYGTPIKFHAGGNYKTVDAAAELEDWAKELGYSSAQKMINDHFDGSLYHALDADSYFPAAFADAKKAGHDGVVVDFGKLKGSGGVGGKVLVTDALDKLKRANE